MSHANTSIDQLIKLVGKTGSDPKLFDVLTSAILKTIPVQKRRKKLMVDINLNKVFKIKILDFGKIKNIALNRINKINEWLDKEIGFINFSTWAVQNGYSDDLVIDRRNPDGNYEPSNCRWITQKENTRNMRSNRVLTAFDESKCIAEWIDDPRCKTTYAGLYQRIQRGYNPERAISQINGK